MLSDLERERIQDREKLDRHTRTTNDIRVKRKLAAWIKNISDVKTILDNLPEDQIRDATHDYDIYLLFNVIQDLLYRRRFYSIEGKADNPDEWKIVVDENTLRPAANTDVIRSSMLGFYLDKLKPFYGPDNPLDKVTVWEQWSKDPDFQDRLTDQERKAIERLANARKEFLEEPK